MTQVPVLRSLLTGWMKFSHGLGRVMSAIILTLFWLVGIGVYAVVYKLIKLIRPTRTVDSYWIPSEAATAETMRRQF